MKPTTEAIRFLKTLSTPEGPNAGEPLNLATIQRQLVWGADSKFNDTGHVVHRELGHQRELITHVKVFPT